MKTPRCRFTLLLALLPFAALSPAFAQAPEAPATPKPAVAAPATQATPAAPATTATPAPAVVSEKEHLAVPVRVTDGHTAVTRTRGELGFTVKSGATPIAFTVDLATLKAALRRIAPEFQRPVAQPRPMVDKGQFLMFEGRDGQTLNVATTAQAIVDAVAKDPATTRFDATLEKQKPTGTTEKYKGIDGVLASFSTKTSANSNRNRNVQLATARIDGLLLAPNEVFSLNKTVGERTEASGFKTAPVFINAELKPGIGGGVSQVTGTLFNAAARAGLKILEVYPHSRPVAYIPIGYDATVVFGEEDLKFKNNTGAPVYIQYKFDLKTRHLAAVIFGHKVAGRDIRLRADVRELAPGKVDAKLFRITRDNGKVVANERLFTHHYRWDPSKKE